MRRQVKRFVSLLLSIAIVATSAPLPVFAAGDTVGYIYTYAGNGVGGYSGDGGLATEAKLDSPFDVAVDSDGNLIIADYYNHRIRVVAVENATKWGIDMTAGFIYTVAGIGAIVTDDPHLGDEGPAAMAPLFGPTSVAVDDSDNIYIAESNAGRVRVVAAASVTAEASPWNRAMTAGYIYTVAGGGFSGYYGDGGPATSAGLNGPNSVALDSFGNIYIADTWNHRVRVVAKAD